MNTLFFHSTADGEEGPAYRHGKLMPFLASFYFWNDSPGPQYKDFRYWDKDLPLRPSMLILNKRQEDRVASAPTLKPLFKDYAQIARTVGIHGTPFTLYCKAPFGLHDSKETPGTQDSFAYSSGVPACCGASFLHVIKENQNIRYCTVSPSIHGALTGYTYPLTISVLDLEDWKRSGAVLRQLGFEVIFKPIARDDQPLFILALNRKPIAREEVIDLNKTLQW